MRRIHTILLWAVVLAAIVCFPSGVLAQDAAADTQVPVATEVVADAGVTAEPVAVVTEAPVEVAMAPNQPVLAEASVAQVEDEPNPLLDFRGASLCYGYSFGTGEDLTIAKASFNLYEGDVAHTLRVGVTADVLGVGPDPLNFSFGSTRLGLGASVNFAQAGIPDHPGLTFGLGVGWVQHHGAVVYATLLRSSY